MHSLVMAGWLPRHQSGLQAGMQTCTWWWPLPMFLLCMHLRKRPTARPVASLFLAAPPSSSKSPTLPGVPKHTPRLRQHWAAFTPQLQVSLQSLLDDAAAKQLPADLPTTAAHQSDPHGPASTTYKAATKLVPVSLKVHAPHEDMRTVGPALLRGLSTTLLAASAAAQGDPPGPMYVGTAAVFLGCIQLLASVFEVVVPRGGGAAAAAVAGAAPGEQVAGAAPGEQVAGVGLGLAAAEAQQLVQQALYALDEVGSSGHQAAACIQGHVAATPGSSSSSSMCSTQEAAVPAVTLVCLDPPCAAEGAAMALDIHLLPPASIPTTTSSSIKGRLVVYSAEGVLVDMPSVSLGGTIRLELPALPAGVYHVALLHTTTSGANLAAACQPLFSHPLLVLPLAAAAELHHHWRCAISAAAVQGMRPHQDHHHHQQQQQQQGRLVDEGGMSPSLAAMRHVWDTQLSNLICDLSAVTLSAADSDAQLQQQQQEPEQPGSMGASLRNGSYDAAAFMHLLQHVLAHLCAQRLWELAAVVAVAGQAVISANGGSRMPPSPLALPPSNLEAMEDTRRSDQGVGACAASTAAAESAVAAAGSAAAAAAASDGGASSGGSSAPAASEAGSCPASGGSGGNLKNGSSNAAAAISGARSTLLQASSSSRGSGVVVVATSYHICPQGVAEELGALNTWGGTWRQLSAGFSNARLEAAYLEYVYDTSFAADVAVVPVLIMVALGHRVLSDAYVAHTPVWMQAAARLLFVALFCGPSILLLVYRRSLRHDSRREQARRLLDMGLGLNGYTLLLGRRDALPCLSRLLGNRWRSWGILVVAGQGALTACCRQVRARTWLQVAAYEYLAWWAASVLLQGRLLLPTALRSLCGALAFLACTVVLELHSRRRLLNDLLQQHGGSVGAAAAATAATAAAVAAKGQVE